MMKRALARALAVGIGTTALFASAVGFSRTSTGHALFVGVIRMAHGGCPFGYDKPMSSAERERAALNFATTHRGTQRAAARPALGFTLDQTTREQVLATMAEHGVQCTSSLGLADLTCDGVPSAVLKGAPVEAAARNLWFTFGDQQRLLSVVAISRDPRAAAISNVFSETERALDAQAGTATQTHGDAAAETLSRGTLSQASAEFRFRDYYAVTRATNMGNGFVFTEEYRSLPD
jgi:hypothetical protein